MRLSDNSHGEQEEEFRLNCCSKLYKNRSEYSVFNALASDIAQDQATPYERAVFDAISSLIAENRDDDVAFDLHYKVSWPLL